MVSLQHWPEKANVSVAPFPLEFHPAAQRGERALRVLHCPWNVAGQSAQLAAAERALGADSRCVVIEETAKGFPADEVLAPANPSILQRERARWRLLSRAILWADVVHFSFGQSCLVPNAFPDLSQINWLNPASVAWRLYCRAVWLKDLPVLSAMGKTLAVTWQGDDARQHDRSLELFDISIAAELGHSYYVPGSDVWKRRTINEFARYVPLHYALNPDLLHVLPSRARFLPYASFDIASVRVQPPSTDETHKLVIGHAPSHRGVKGTQALIDAVSALKSEGYDFELWLVENMDRREALKQYETCDIIVDQLVAGWYGGFALEAMALGKPVVAYLREGDLGFLPDEMRRSLPVKSATSETLGDVLRHLLHLPRRNLRDLGYASRDYAERWHNPLLIAAQTLSDYYRRTPEVLG